MGKCYTDLLADTRSLQLPLIAADYAENIYWVYGVVLREAVPFDAVEAMRRLAERGVDTRPFFWCMHEQPVLRQRGLFTGETYPVAERLARRGFYLPSGVAIRQDQMEISATALKDLVG
jgi:perosamine synthetase